MARYIIGVGGEGLRKVNKAYYSRYKKLVRKGKWKGPSPVHRPFVISRIVRGFWQ